MGVKISGDNLSQLVYFGEKFIMVVPLELLLQTSYLIYH